MFHKRTALRLLAVLAVAVVFTFAACEKLSVSKLTSNYHFSKANKLFTENQYRKAIAEYEAIDKANNAFSADAKKRLAVLKSPEGLDFYKKFAEYNPPRPPETGAFGKLPFDATSPPDQGGGFSKTILNLDDLSKKIDAKDSGKATPDKSAPDKPAPKPEAPKK